MSYSFTVTGADKEATKQAVADEFDKMMGVQSVHSKDRTAAIANASAVIDLMADDDAKGISVTLNGHVSYASGGLNGASIACTAHQVMLP
jgi:hypothetical protein